MATMAQWGDIAFRVNSEQVFTFRKLSRSYSSRWHAHEVIGEKSKMEYQGPDLQELTIEVFLDAEYGTKPLDALNRFRAASESGEVNHFYVGGKRLSDNPFYIASGIEDWKEVWNEGELVRASAQLTFGEYR